ncbi:DUF4065 domain-containing protein [Dietzia sp. SLG510A3-30A2]|nr:DUF4065 domain-containing protein [Dietzia sp. SLG510A3-30A2]
MATTVDVGQYVYSQLGWVDAWKLEKLTYYAQAWYLAWDGRRLVDDEFQAWADGPVSPRLHRVNKYERSGPWSQTLPEARLDALDQHARLVIDAVLAHYGPMSKHDLIELTHSEDPWLIARGSLPEGAQSQNIVEVRDIRRYYTRQALTGGGGPVLPPIAATAVPEAPDQVQFCAETSLAEINRWSEALALLAER